MATADDPAAVALLALAGVLRASAADRPLIVAVMTQLMDRLEEAGAAFRRTEASALAKEGLSHERIGQLFGVTRQRVGALLKQ